MLQGSEELFSVDPLQSQTGGGHSGTHINERLSTSEVSHIVIQRLTEDDANSSRTVSESRLRASGFAPAHHHHHDEGGETEGDQDGEEGMDDGEHDHEGDGVEGDEQAQGEGGGGSGTEPMAIGESGEQESDMELDMLVESESDSDDNQSNLNDTASSAQRSAQTHATAGSDATGGVANLALFSDDDSDESTQQVRMIYVRYHSTGLFHSLGFCISG